MRAIILPFLLLASTGAFAQDCTRLAHPATAPEALPVLPSLAPELTASSTPLGSPSGVLAQAFPGEAGSVDAILLRIRIDACRTLAMSTTPGALVPGQDPATYVPRTEFDNAPWRFDMNQNGKRMTADEFSAWMEAKGVRVAKGAKPAAPAPAPTPAPAEAPAATTTQGD